MSSPRYTWWGYAKAMIRRYPERRRLVEEMRDPSTAISLSGLPSGSGKVSRPTEQAALRQLPPTEQKEFEAVDEAFKETATLPNGKLRLQMINLVYWRQTHTIQGAAMRLYVSEKTAKRWHKSFILLVAKKYGLLDKVDPLEPKK